MEYLKELEKKLRDQQKKYDALIAKRNMNTTHKEFMDNESAINSAACDIETTKSRIRNFGKRQEPGTGIIRIN